MKKSCSAAQHCLFRLDADEFEAVGFVWVELFQ
jgi:hypothetical protein